MNNQGITRQSNVKLTGWDDFCYITRITYSAKIISTCNIATEQINWAIKQKAKKQISRYGNLIYDRNGIVSHCRKKELYNNTCWDN